VNDTHEVEFDFGERMPTGDDGETPDFSGQTPLGPCPNAVTTCSKLAMPMCANAQWNGANL
jgi:DNA topoisomerase-3